MKREQHTPSEERRKEILAHSSEALANLPHSYGSQSFILSEYEAEEVGEAIHTRNHRAIYDVIGGVLDSAVEDFVATGPEECIGVWNQSFESIYGEGITLGDLLANNDTRELLNYVLTGSEKTQLGMDTTEYLKLIETIAIATMPDKGIKSIPESRRSRTGGSERALFNRSVSQLSMFADSTPGIRTMRENVLNTDPNALNKYLGSMVKSHSAQSVLANLMELNEHDIRRKKAGLERIFNEEQIDHDMDIEDLLHILEWKILNNDEEDRETRHTRIKKIIEGQSQTERQRRQLDYDWCPERLDFLIEIAETAKTNGRHPSMFISNRFEEGAGVYVAVELDNPHDPTKKMLFADNPIAGNALYIVDEAGLSNEGRPNYWQKVLGANRRIARERGALRKYHTKNWQAILPKVMTMGETLINFPVETVQPTHDTEIHSDEQLITQSRLLQARIKAFAKAAQRLS